MICTFALHICQYDKNMLSSMIASVVLFYVLENICIQVCLRLYLYLYDYIHVTGDSPVTGLYTNKIDLI